MNILLLKKLIIWLLFGMYLNGCANAVWLKKDTPLDGPKAGVLMFRNRPTRGNAFKKAAEFCSPQTFHIDEEGMNYGEVSGFGIKGFGRVRQSKDKYIQFQCVQSNPEGQEPK